ncbi:hypothetical protein QCD79_08280 [Pseudomonas quasicaspiana]|nr:hypothetical protein [Pseudomonas quasicaspiana]
MTWEGFWQSWWAFGFVMGPFLLSIFTFIVCIYISNRHLDSMLDALKNSRHIVIHGAGLKHQGWFGRAMLATKIGGVVLFPGPLIRAGEIDFDDIKNFPRQLGRLVKAHLILLLVAIIWAAIAFVALKLK